MSIVLLWISVSLSAQIVPGADQTWKYLPLLRGKTVGVMVNPSSRIGNGHLVDSLMAKQIKVVRIFAPEHGFRGDAEAGEHIKSGKDQKTGIEVVSLYGKNNKPSVAQLKGIQVLVFDIQDVGARFYTYLSSLHYFMEAAAENAIPVIVLDRPNPNGHYIDGPILQDSLRSFVGVHPIPIVHGMTLGELAQMINGEGWLKGKKKCKLTVIPCKAYSHSLPYSLPVRPSPNLPNDRSVLLYPSLALFEGTEVSVGRGTPAPFNQYGTPWYKAGTDSFIPKSLPGFAVNPPFRDKMCYGKSFEKVPVKDLYAKRKLDLQPLLSLYKACPTPEAFFNNFFDTLAGTRELRRQILKGMSEEQIRATWQNGLKKFKASRKKYLLYPDFKA